MNHESSATQLDDAPVTPLDADIDLPGEAAQLPSPPPASVRPTAFARWRFHLLLFAGVLAVFFLVRNAGYLDSSDADERFEVLRAIVEKHTVIGVVRWYPQPAPSRYSIGSVVPSIPFFVMGKFFYRVLGSHDSDWHFLVQWVTFSTAFYSAILVVVLAALARAYNASWRTSLGIALIAGFGTLLFPFTKTYQCENLTGLALALTLLGVIRHETTRRIVPLIVGGLAAGYLFCTKPEYAIALFALGVYLLWTVRFGRTLVFSLATLPGIALALWYNYARYKKWIAHGYDLYFNHPLIEGAYLQLLSAGKGIFWYVPVFLASFALLPKFCKLHGRRAVLPFVFWFVMLIVYSKFSAPTGDATLGSRYLVPWMGILVLPLVTLVGQRAERWQVWTFRVLLILSLGLQIVHVATPYLFYLHSRLGGAADFETALKRYFYFPAESPLLGNWNVFRRGTYDLFFIHRKPLANELTVYPLFWIIAAAASVLLGYALTCAARLDGIMLTNAVRRVRMLRRNIPVVFCIFAAVGFLYPKRDRLKLAYQKDGKTWHETITSGPNTKHLAWDPLIAYGMALNGFTLKYKGAINAPLSGQYNFELKCAGRPKLEIDDTPLIVSDEMSTTPTKHLASRTLDQGWHKIELRYDHSSGDGPLVLKWQPPGRDMRLLSRADLRPDMPE